jgi:DNA-binding transcriptional LysR family regulator
VAAAQAATNAVAAVQGLLRGTLAGGTMQILPPAVDLLAVLGRFHAAHPGVELRLRPQPSPGRPRPGRPGRAGREPFVDFQPDWGLRMLLDQSFAAAGLHRASALEGNDVPSLLQLVARGLGIALVPRSSAATRPPSATSASARRHRPSTSPWPPWATPRASQAARVLLAMLDPADPA